MRSLSLYMSVAFAALAFLLYAPTIWNGTIIDDVPLLHADLSLRQLAFDSGPPRDLAYYRPITVSSYLLLQAFGQGPGQVYAAHISNLLFYAAAAASVYWLTHATAGGRWAAFGAAAATLLFVVHPIHTESVAWITARPDVIAGLFMVGALFAYRRYRESGHGGWLAAMALASLGAPLSKEVGTSIFLLLPAFEWLHVSRLGFTANQPATTKGARKPVATTGGRLSALPLHDTRVTAAIALAAAGGVYLGLRLIVFHGAGSSELELSYLTPAKMFGAIGLYAEKLFVPRHLIAFYAEVPADAATIATGVIAASVWCIAVAAAIVKRWHTLAFGLLWMAITLAPSMPVFVAGPSHAPIAERYLYLPSIGLAVCIAWLVSTALTRLDERRVPSVAGGSRALAGVAIPILIVAGLFAYATVTRLHAYSDVETFWATTVRDNPTAGFPRAGLAAAYAQQGRLDEAAQEFKLAAEEGVFEGDNERRALAYDSLGAVHTQLGDYGSAVEAYQRGIALFPSSPLLHSNLAITHYNEAHRAQPPDRALLGVALDEAQLAVERDEDDQRNLMIVARIAEELGDIDLARATYQRVVRIDGSTAEGARAGQGLVRLQAIEQPPENSEPQ